MARFRMRVRGWVVVLVIAGMVSSMVPVGQAGTSDQPDVTDPAWDFGNTTLDWETVDQVHDEVGKHHQTAKEEWDRIPGRWQDTAAHTAGCDDDLPDLLRRATCFEDPRCHPEVPNHNLCPRFPPHLEGATSGAMDLRAGWFDYQSEFPNNQDGPRNLQGLAVVAAEVRGVSQSDLQGAFMEGAGWIVRFAVDGHDYAIGTYRWRPCVERTNCLDPAFMTQQPWIACEDGQERPVRSQVDAILGYDQSEHVIRYGLEPHLVGSPDAGTTIDDLRWEIRRFPGGENFSCEGLDDAPLMDRAPDAGGAACEVTTDEGCVPLQG